MNKLVWYVCLFLVVAMMFSCGDTRPPSAPAVKMRDSSALLVTYGASKLISDSGKIRYKIVAEEWKFFDRTNPSRNYFPKGLLLEKFDAKFHIEMYITADTAYWYNQNLWKLCGRVKVWNRDGSVFTSSLLYYDMGAHEFYSSAFSHFKTPDKEVECTAFRADEQMRHYVLNDVKATLPLSSAEPADAKAANDSLKETEKKEGPQPESVVENRMPTPRRAREVEDPNKPKGGHFK